MRGWALLLLMLGVGGPVFAAEHGGGEKAGKSEGHDAAKEGSKEGDKKDEALPEEAPQLRQGRVFSDTEVQVLMDLDRQRVEMERREQALELREKLVDLMEQRLNAKVADLKELQTALEKLLGNVSGKDDKELDQLAMIYGNMKPAVAAGVLNRLDNLIVLDVIKRMPAKKSGKLMEALDPAKARVISEMMAAETPPPAVSATTP